MKNTLSSVLWDVREAEIPSLPRDFVIQRVLTYGTIGFIIEVMGTYGAEVVRDVFLSLKPTTFPHKKYLYLRNYLFS